MEQAVLNQGAERFGRGSYSLQLLGGFDQNVFEYIGEDGLRFIIKFLDAAKYRKASIIRELTWMAYLAEHGLNIASSIRSAQDLLIEEIIHGSKRYYVIAFTKAPGSPLSDLTSDFAMIERWGRGMGSMHKLGKKDSTSASLVHRMAFPQWNDHLIFTDAFPETAGERVHTQWRRYLKELESLPQDQDSYGIVHNDLHHNNFHVHNGEIVFFDFGDVSYHWFAYDIAIAIYHAVQTVPEHRKAEFVARFFDSFLSGYLKENTLSADWIERIPFFIDFRNLYSYVYFSKFVDWNEMDESTRNYLLAMKADIESGQSVVNLSI
ncbi:Ser/Thr protein kinase RdoA (MazF antagonist) [Paenibacillus sp. LBL]|uniref:phosphotransferase enzyme family protein n=1 Tax=Paenibacillus TaxID=44249 RepID=UPI00128DBB4B|nr:MULTISPECIES: phosphotransferase [Paenibacillus]MDH6671429.1 Ser/Thr protein kinase RdoA (MazF antagonist) [Paenibacillus sp. LBL]MPY15639.1 phosphotransferase [Paenibacillus glucanolyticus]